MSLKKLLPSLPTGDREYDLASLWLAVRELQVIETKRAEERAAEDQLWTESVVGK